MDGNVQQRSSRSSSLAQSPTNDDDDTDTISLTSTVEPQDPPDTLYVVEDIHAEKEEVIDGQIQTRYLVEWANFPLDQCTWEPLENLEEETAKQWEEKKATQDPSVPLEFEKKYLAAFHAKLERARRRHRKRNTKRKRLNLPTTLFWFRRPWFDSEDEVASADEGLDSEAEPFTPSSDDNHEGEEAAEDNAVDDKATMALESSKPSSKTHSESSKPSKTKSPKPVRPSSRVFTFEPGKAGKSFNAKNRDAIPSKAPETFTRSSIIREPQRPQSSKQQASTSGYQGSARKSSTASSSTSHSATGPIPKAANLTPAAVTGQVLNSDTAVAKAPSQTTKKTLTGKKTTKPSIPVDVFSGGKVRRRRQGVGESEVDNTQAPKLYKSANYRRKAELRSRDRDDQAPEFSKVFNMAFAPGSNAEPPHSAPLSEALTKLGGKENTPSQIIEEPEEQSIIMPPARPVASHTSDNGPRCSSVLKRGSLSAAFADDRPNKKVKTAKRVHFTEVEAGPSASHGPSPNKTRSERFPQADDKHPNFIGEGLFVDDSMDIDSITDSVTNQPADTLNSLVASSKKLALSTYKSRKSQSVQNVGKKMKLSTSAERILDITFDAFPAVDSVASAEQWINDFLKMSCLEIGHEVLAETLTTQLPLLLSLGFQPLCSGTITSISDSKDLDVLAEHLRMRSSGLFIAEAQFNLLIFPTKCANFEGLSSFDIDPTSPGGIALKYFMFRSAVPIFQQIRPSSNIAQGHKTSVGEEKVVLFPTLLGIQYSTLIASADKDKKLVHFFLAFPERALDWQRSIGSWLSTREKTCKIYTNFDAGSWLAFVEKAKKERGIIIVHEALVPHLRRFPQLAKLLVKYTINVWHLSESVDLGPPQPLKGSLIIPAMSTKVSRLFPVGSVVLVTPSFLVSEPQAAYKFFKWFFDIRVNKGNHKLMVAYKITDYLSELSREKSELRARLENDLWLRKANSPLEIADDKNKAALTDQDLEARQKTWLYMEWWLSQQVHSQVPFSSFNSTIFADRSIDPHDEQSLVNWFGWWSIEHSHEYRKFYILGSSSKGDGGSIHTLTSRTSRKVPLPKYSLSVVNDPDEAVRIALSKQGPITSGSVDVGFQSQCFHDDENQIGPWLRSQDKGFFSKLFSSPVSWIDKKMATHYGDPDMSFKTIEQWWDSLIPWTSGSHHYNTFVGFFYTIAEEWDPDKPSNPIKPKRHPWLAIWRPVDPHNKALMYSHGKTELLIWDVRAGEIETKKPIQLKDLTWMQRELVKHIQHHAHEKNPDSFLDRVWLGGFRAHRVYLKSSQPADMTAEFLVRVTDDLRMTVPAAGKFLFTNGWRQVALRTGPYQEEQDDDPSVDEDTRIIFHAPRATKGLMPRGLSNCINELYEAANQERLRPRHAREMVYTYPPTMAWYKKQVAEGRHFEHIYVDEWDKVFSSMGVDKATSSSGSVPQASGRRGSGSSTRSIPRS